MKALLQRVVYAQVDVDGERVQRHQAGHQDDQFDAADREGEGFVWHLRPMARSGGRGYRLYLHGKAQFDDRDYLLLPELSGGIDSHRTSLNNEM